VCHGLTTDSISDWNCAEAPVQLVTESDDVADITQPGHPSRVELTLCGSSSDSAADLRSAENTDVNVSSVDNQQ